MFLWMDDSKASQKVGQLLISQLNFFKSSLGNLTWGVASRSDTEGWADVGELEDSELLTGSFEDSRLPETTSEGTKL